MVSGMLGRLRLSQTTDGQHTQHQHNRDKFTGWVVHRQTTGQMNKYIGFE
jgi:hypothetical protein